MSQIGELVDCPASMWITSHQTNDCSDTGITVKMPEDEFKEVMKTECEAVVEGFKWQKNVCDATGLWAAYFSDKECTKAEGGFRAYEWGACNTENKFSVHKSDPVPDVTTTDAFSTKAALGSVILALAAFMN